MKGSFYSYHPVVQLIFFMSVLGFTMFFRHPVMLSVSIVMSFLYF